MLNRIVFAAGGTGGHIFPAIAVADELKKMNPGIKISFIGARGRMEERVVPENGYQLETIDIRGFSRSLNFKNFRNLIKLPAAMKRAGSMLKEHSPQLVFATGGYVSGPVVLSAFKQGIPSVLFEGNYYPGLTTRFLSSRADKILVNFPGSPKFYKDPAKVEVMSYPVRMNFKSYPRKEAVNFFGLKPDKKTIFVFGGSQGASSINNAFLKMFAPLTGLNTQLIWQTGERDYERVNKTVKDSDSIRIFKFIDKIDYAYSAADLVICRSGIAAVMEVAYYGVPAIFVPYPYSTDDHQMSNARRFNEKDAAEIVIDKNLDAELADKILSLIFDDSKLTRMRTNIAQFCDRNAARKMASYLVEFNEKRFTSDGR